MKFNFLLVCTISAILFSFCKKEKPGPFNPIDPNPIDTVSVVPVDTMPFCEIMVNGELWTPNPYGVYLKSAHTDGKRLRFAFSDPAPPGWLTPKYELYLAFIERKIGRQSLGLFKPSAPVPSSILVFFDVDNPSSRYKVDTLATYPAFVELTKIDTNAHLVEGIFECSTIREDEPDSNGLIKHRWDFRNGKFRMKYVEY